MRVFLSRLAILLIWPASGCGTSDPAADSSPDVNLPGIVLIVADTLRADRLGSYGYPKPTSPWLDALASESIFFERAYAQSNATNPSHASLFTSTYLSTHGILDNKGYELSEKAVTLAEVLRKQGYATAGFTSVRHLDFGLNGLEQGFEFHSGAAGFSPAEETNARVFQWLDQRQSRRPLFLFVHYFDTHTPYRPPDRYLKRFYQGNPRDPSNPSMDAAWAQPDRAGAFEEWLRGVTDVEYVKALYDGAIAYLDDQVRELAEGLKRRGLWRQSIVVFTADHGESLDEHQIYFGHLGLYQPSIRIPCWLRVPQLGPQTISGPVQSIDIAPTLLALLKRPVPPVFEGFNLLPGIRGAASPPASSAERPIYAEHAHGAVVSLLVGPWKYLYPIHPNSRLPESEELYHLQRDPTETDNLATHHPDRARAMRQHLKSWLEARRPHALTPRARRPSRELLEKLRSLGYVR